MGWDPGLLKRVRDSFPVDSPRWIVSLDAHGEEMYRRLRGAGFAEAVRTAELLLSLFPRRTWVQAVRMKENEDDLDSLLQVVEGEDREHHHPEIRLLQRHASRPEVADFPP